MIYAHGSDCLSAFSVFAFFVRCRSDVQYTDSHLHINILPDHHKGLNFRRRYLNFLAAAYLYSSYCFSFLPDLGLKFTTVGLKSV